MKKSLTLLLLTFYCFLHGQETLIEVNDSIAQYENLPINNGLSYENKYWNTTNDTKQFYNNEYTKCTISYDGKLYSDVKLKFDILNNQILFKPKFNVISEIVLINELVDYFIINQKKFIKLNINNHYQYFEEIKINNEDLLLIKHIKTFKEDLSTGEKKYSFYDNFEIYLNHKKAYYFLNNKNSLITIFPNYKKEIQNFYKSNELLKENNLILFYTKLINELISIK